MTCRQAYGRHLRAQGLPRDRQREQIQLLRRHHWDGVACEQMLRKFYLDDMIRKCLCRGTCFARWRLIEFGWSTFKILLYGLAMVWLCSQECGALSCMANKYGALNAHVIHMVGERGTVSATLETRVREPLWSQRHAGLHPPHTFHCSG